MAIWGRKQSLLGTPAALAAQDPNNWAMNTMSQSALASHMAQAALLRQMAVGHSAPTFTPSKKYPTTLGFRSWVWDMTANELRSPVHGTTWDGPELRCETWGEAQVVRGVAGIHAYLVPDDWHTIPIPEAPNGGKAYAELRGGELRACVAVHGVVERFGKFVLGTDGWRAEWVVIRQLAAPTDEIGLALERAFPDAEVIYGNR